MRPGALRWHAGVVRELVALALPAGPAFVDAVERSWDAGDAVLPLDPAAPDATADELIDRLGPTRIIERDGESRHLEGGWPVEVGDALVVASSGTTGLARGAVHTHAGVEYAAFASSVAAGVAADTRWLGCLPLHHVAGFGVLARALVTGAGVELHPRFEAAAVDEAARRGATHVSLVPTALERIDASLWRTILLGGSAIPAMRPDNTIATYGMTETLGGVVYEGVCLPGVAVRVLDPERHHDPLRPHLAPSGVVGPIELRTPTLMRDYRRRPGGADDASRAPTDHDGWFRTGDLGSIEAGTERLVVHGRADDLIVTGGEKVWPSAVESVIAADQRVAEVAVLGEIDPEWGQRVVAVVVPTDPSTPPHLEALRDLVRTQLPRAAAPKELRLVASLPRTELGKVRRSGLGVGDLRG